MARSGSERNSWAVDNIQCLELGAGFTGVLTFENSLGKYF